MYKNTALKMKEGRKKGREGGRKEVSLADEGNEFINTFHRYCLRPLRIIAVLSVFAA